MDALLSLAGSADTVSDLIVAAGASRQRPIVRVERRLGAGHFGLWVKYADHDLIVVDRDQRSALVDHVALHELGHILLEHVPAEVNGARRDAADPPREMHEGSTGCVTPLSRRMAEQEREAERFAELVVRRWRRGRRSARHARTEEVFG